MTNLQSDVKAAPAPSAGIGQVHVLIYRSHSLVQPAEIDHELSHILRTARARNASLGITGALMLYDNWFAQVLEGPEGAVKSLFARIEADKRHNGVEVLEQGPADKRAFERWAMAHVGEHGEADIPMMAVGDHVEAAAPWRSDAGQEERLTQLRQATRGYGRGS